MPSTFRKEASPQEVVRSFLMSNKGRARIVLGGSRMLVQASPANSNLLNKHDSRMQQMRFMGPFWDLREEYKLPPNHRFISTTCHVRIPIPRKLHPPIEMNNHSVAPDHELECPLPQCPNTRTSWEEASPQVVRSFLMANRGRPRIVLGGAVEC
ncbi:hypothetical protein CEXT_37541 [Caerostris extrusa]|uniref:Uncharacterized protein n=1 Tax=Caerostris extrusa TaxID=172846 RepID=A0AAV4WCX0_CAEEX|nr:hypothetical protein CEXT_37541 [Caerostris extrusa]